MDRLYITAVTPEGIALTEGDLPACFFEDANRYKKEKDRALSLACRKLLADHLRGQGIDPCGCVLKREAQGKPYLEGGEVFFSFSHSGDLSVLLVSDAPCGVDVEKVNEDRETDALFHRLFSKGEWQDYDASEDKALFFTTLWTKKEAKGKMLGTGIFPDSMKELDVSDCESALLVYDGARYCLSWALEGETDLAGDWEILSGVRFFA